MPQVRLTREQTRYVLDLAGHALGAWQCQEAKNIEERIEWANALASMGYAPLMHACLKDLIDGYSGARGEKLKRAANLMRGDGNNMPHQRLCEIAQAYGLALPARGAHEVWREDDCAVVECVC